MITHLLLSMTTAFASVPVFRNPSSALPSGEFPRVTLESKTREVKEFPWMRVETGTQIGWVELQDIWQPIDLAKKALIKKGSPLRGSPSDNATPAILAPAEFIETIQKRRGMWIQITYQNKPYWLKKFATDPVKSSNDDSVVTQTTPLYKQPGQSQIRGIDAGERVQTLSRDKSFSLVQTPHGRGFIESKHLWQPPDTNKLIVRTKQAPMRAEPLLQARITQSLEPGSKLNQVRFQITRWGLAYLSPQNIVWWPLLDDKQEPLIAKKTSELFKAPLFDIASSPILPNLRILSAGAVYRTLDGENWEKLANFNDQDYPLAIAKNGTIFVGDSRSFNHGENFEEYIQWDQLVNTLKPFAKGPLTHLKLVKIDLIGGSDQRIKLTLRNGTAEWQVRGEGSSYDWRVESSR